MNNSMVKTVRLLCFYAGLGIYSGFIQSERDEIYFRSCSCLHRQTGTLLIFTRDSGHHSGGWFKNPQYERCYHLSISFRDPITLLPRLFDKKLAAQWVKEFFGNNDRLLWCEPPYTKEGKQAEVFHYRLFCDEAWQPIKPRGEVYSREFTEKGWKSFSEVHDQKKAEEGL